MQQVFSGRVTWLSSLLKETIDARLFARSEHAPDQTELQPQRLQCLNDLSPACAIMPVFHAVSRVEGPYQQHWRIARHAMARMFNTASACTSHMISEAR